MADRKTTSGCLGALLHMFTVFPLWISLVYGVMLASDPEQWVWMVFYAYVPVSVIVAIVRATFEVLASSD